MRKQSIVEAKKQQKNKKCVLIIGTVCLTLVTICVEICLIPSLRNSLALHMVRRPVLIAHAMGGISDGKYSNSLEAFEENYEKGMRIFEADFSVTSDHVMILRHDWTKSRGQKGLIKYDGYIPTYEEFMTTPLYGKYTPLSLADLFNLMKDHKDVYIITDSKAGSYEQVVDDFRLIYDTAQQTDSLNLLDRFIVQIYNDEMYDAVQSVYPFENIIYTLYQRGTDNLEQLCAFCTQHNITIITVNYKKYSTELQRLADENHLQVYLHTLNKSESALLYYRQGVDGFYTDNITPVSWIKHSLLSLYDNV